MKKIRMFVVMAACAGFLASEVAAEDKVTVPLSSPTQPVTVKVHLMNGSITVTGGASGQVIVESAEGASRPGRPQKDVPAGMHRIEIGHMGMDVEEDHNVVTVSNMRGGGNVTIQVPSNASLELKAMSGGHIDVTGVNGEIEVNNLNGPINLMNVSGSVVAHSLNGAVTATLDKVSPGKPMSFTSLNGKIDVTLPADTKARVRLKTDHGSVYSDFDVKMEPDASKPAVEDAQGKGGKYKIKIDRGVYGSLNGGGPEYRFETMNGNILIHKK